MEPSDWMTQVIKPRSFQQAKDVPPRQAAIKAEYQDACIAACDGINDKIIVLLYWYNHEYVEPEIVLRLSLKSKWSI